MFTAGRDLEVVRGVVSSLKGGDVVSYILRGHEGVLTCIILLTRDENGSERGRG